jgi:endonuclease YncB( thermonuclease family)
MTSRKKNQIFVTLFLLSVLGFTGLMTFYVGPKMMAIRTQVAQDQVLFKCQKVIDGNSIEVQMRGWERPNTNPVFPLKFAGLNTPPLGTAESPAVLAWAEAHQVAPAVAASFGKSAQKTLVAFIRKQNLFLYREDGSRSSKELVPGSRVHVMVSGTNVNLKLLESGLALHDTTHPHAYADLYANAQKEAKSAKNGLWGTLQDF